MNSTVLLLASALALHSIPVLASDSVAPARYSLKQEAPDIGSHILRDIVSNGLIPVNRRYAELTPEQQGLLKSQYESMADGDEPPFPADGLASIYNPIAKGQQKLLVRGTLELHVEISPNGEATAVKVFRSPDPEMTRFAAAVLMATKYKPAICSGSPCQMSFPFVVNLAVR